MKRSMFSFLLLAVCFTISASININANESKSPKSGPSSISIIQSATVPSAPTGVSWDEDDAQLAADSITVFNFYVDTNCGAVQLISKVGSTAGVSSFVVPFPVLSADKHTLSIAACNTDLCSPATPLVLTVPVAPKNLKKR